VLLATLGAASLELRQLGAAGLVASAQTVAGRPTELTIASEAAELRLRFDPAAGRLGLASLAGHGTTWAGDDSALGGALWIDRVQVDGGPATTIDGSGGLRLVNASDHSMTMLHSDSGLSIALDYDLESGNAIIHRATLANTARRA